MPNVASEARRGGGRVGRREEQAGKDEHRRGRVNVEIEKLDGRADQAGEEHLAGRVERARLPWRACSWAACYPKIRRSPGTYVGIS